MWAARTHRTTPPPNTASTLVHHVVAQRREKRVTELRRKVCRRTIKNVSYSRFFQRFLFQILKKLPELDIAAAKSSSHGEFLWLTGPTLPLLGEDPPPDEACAVRPSVSTNSSLLVHYHLIMSKGPLRCRRQPSLTN